MGFLHDLLGTSMNNIISCLFHSIEYRLFRTILRCLLGFRDILRCWEVFQCLQEDVFKLGKANYLSFKSWR